jgi:lipopolysaccharide transport protein LptA
MRRKAKPSITRIFRFMIASSLLLILILISFYFIIRSKKPPKYLPESNQITQQKVEKKEKVVHSEVKGERENFRMRADKHYVGEDNKNHLEGNVEIIDFGKTEDKHVYIYGEEVIYNKKLNHFALRGRSKVKYKDLIIESDFFDYYKKKEVFKGSKGVNFSSRRLTGSAKEMVYSLGEESLILRREVRLQLMTESADLPLIIQGSGLHYSREKRTGKVLGKVKLSQGQSKASAQSLEFILAEDEEDVKSITLRGRVKASLVGKKEGRREIRADEIYLEGFKELSRVSCLKATGNGSFRTSTPSRSSLLVQGESLSFLFSPEGELERFDASQKVRMIEHWKHTGEKRVAEGEEMSIMGKTEILHIRGSEKMRAKVSSQDNEIHSEEITIELENNNMEAKKGVKAVFKRREGKKSLGFFSKEQPVFISAQEMRYLREEKRFFFNREIKVWQQKEMLLAEELIIMEESGEVNCRGGVKSVFIHKMKKRKREERLEIAAEKMNFHPEKDLVAFEEKSSLQVGNIDLRAQYVSVHLEEGGEIKAIVAQGNVRIVQETAEGRGEKANYDLEEETITLTGDPVFVEKDRGETRGDKLTFYMGDGRITVQNKERERSVTVIKS